MDMWGGNPLQENNATQCGILFLGFDAKKRDPCKRLLNSIFTPLRIAKHHPYLQITKEARPTGKLFFFNGCKASCYGENDENSEVGKDLEVILTRSKGTARQYGTPEGGPKPIKERKGIDDWKGGTGSDLNRIMHKATIGSYNGSHKKSQIWPTLK